MGGFGFAGGPGFFVGRGQDSLSQVVSVRSFTAVAEGRRGVEKSGRLARLVDEITRFLCSDLFCEEELKGSYLYGFSHRAPEVAYLRSAIS
jgi:hypothetical protein